MQFYKKIFTAFFVLLTITTRVAVGDDGTIISGGVIGGFDPTGSLEPPIIFPIPDPVVNPSTFYPPLPEGDNVPICEPNEYITKCDFHLAGDDPSTTAVENGYWVTGVALTPENIFAFLAAKTGYLCWDFDNPEKNYYNLHILFGADHDATMDCYVGYPGLASDKLYIIFSGQEPLAAKVTVPYLPPANSVINLNYGSVGALIKNACQVKSVPENDALNPERSCAPCPNKGAKQAHSAGAFAQVVDTGAAQTATWTKFTTIADCYYWDNANNHTHEDNTGWFKYINAPDNGACYYSGE